MCSLLSARYIHLASCCCLLVTKLLLLLASLVGPHCSLLYERFGMYTSYIRVNMSAAYNSCAFSLTTSTAVETPQYVMLIFISIFVDKLTARYKNVLVHNRPLRWSWWRPPPKACHQRLTHTYHLTSSSWKACHPHGAAKMITTHKVGGRLFGNSALLKGLGWLMKRGSKRKVGGTCSMHLSLVVYFTFYILCW